MANNRQHNILGGDGSMGRAFDPDAHVFHLLGDQTLGRQHMLYLRGANPVSQCRKCAVGGGVGVATDQGHTREGRALLRANHMHDPLANITHGKFGDLKFGTILVEGFYLQS